MSLKVLVAYTFWTFVIVNFPAENGKYAVPSWRGQTGVNGTVLHYHDIIVVAVGTLIFTQDHLFMPESKSLSASILGLGMLLCGLLFFSVSDRACRTMSNLYRGNHGVNEALHTRGFYTGSKKTDRTSRQELDLSLNMPPAALSSEAIAKALVKQYVQIDSTVFQNPQGDSTLTSDLVGANPELLSLSIDSPSESSFVTKDDAFLKVTATGMALAPSRHQEAEAEGKESPQRRGAKVRVKLDGQELRFTGGSQYKIPLQDSLHISFDLLDHGLEVNGTRVHLVEVELVLEAFEGGGDAVLGTLRATSSVAFLFVGEPYLPEFPPSPLSFPYLELWHPRMMPTTQRGAIDRRVDFAAGAEVDFFIEMAPTTLNLHSAGVVALFTLDGSHHDITSLLREELGNAENPVVEGLREGMTEETVKRARLVVAGDLDPGPHTITVTLLEASEEPVSLSTLFETSAVLAQRQMLVASR